MNHLSKFLVLFALCFASCKTSLPVTNSDTVSESGGIVGTQMEKVTPILELTSASKVELKVSFLASDALEGRDTGTEGIEKAAVYIEELFKTIGVEPFYDTYRDNFEVRGKQAFNVVGVIEGNDPELKDEIVLLGAHYDHIGIVKAIGGDAIANGANDNAAGTAAVLELAEYFASTKSNKRTLVFALFSAEEIGLLGSRNLAKRMKSENVDIYFMLNFEMIGLPMNNRPYMTYLTGYENSNMAEIINQYAGSELVGLLQRAKEMNLFKRSDNYPFYGEYKIPAQTVSTFDFENFPHYHLPSDEADQLDYMHLAKVVNAFKPVVEAMTNSSEKEIRMNE